jgi:hypothetical protein
MERSRHEQPGFARRVGATRRVYTDNLFRDVPPLKSIEEVGLGRQLFARRHDRGEEESRPEGGQAAARKS